MIYDFEFTIPANHFALKFKDKTIPENPHPEIKVGVEIVGEIHLEQEVPTTDEFAVYVEGKQIMACFNGQWMEPYTMNYLELKNRSFIQDCIAGYREEIDRDFKDVLQDLYDLESHGRHIEFLDDNSTHPF